MLAQDERAIIETTTTTSHNEVRAESSARRELPTLRILRYVGFGI